MSVRELFADGVFQAALRASLAVALVIGAFVLFQRAWVIIQPLIVAIVLATALWPWVSRLTSLSFGKRQWRMPRVLAATLIYVTSFATAGVILWVTLGVLVPQFDRMLDRFPEQTAAIREYVEPFRAGDIATGAARVAGDVVGETTKTANSGQRQAEPEAEPNPGPISVGAFALGLFGGLVSLILVLVFTFFLLLEGDRFAQWMVMALPRRHRPHVRDLGQRICERVSRWVLAQAIYALLSGLIVGSAMWLLQVPSPWLYGVLALLFAILPGIGPAVATIPAIFVTLELSPWQPIAIALFAIALNIVDGMVVSPKVYGEMMRLPMFIVLLAVLIGSVLMGIWGALISTPIAVAIQMVIRDQMGRDPSTLPS